MNKSISYPPYILAIIVPAVPVITNNLLSKQGVTLAWAGTSLFILGLWWVIDRLLRISENRFAKLGYVLLGSSLYSFFFIGLDYYFLHVILQVLGFSLDVFYTRLSFLIVLSTCIIESINLAKAREDAKMENLTLQTKNIEAQFNLLVQQVNPNFLFYSLKTLRGMIGSDDPQAETYLLKLADVFRQTLKKERSTVSLQEELTFLESYLFLMRYGREKAIIFDINVLDESLNYLLPIFTLQLLTENCMKHNAFSATEPLYVQLFQKEPKSVTIVNNYQSKDTSTESFGGGIDSLKVRYAFAGSRDAVIIEQNETTYSITIKLLSS